MLSFDWIHKAIGCQSFACSCMLHVWLKHVLSLAWHWLFCVTLMSVACCLFSHHNT